MKWRVVRHETYGRHWFTAELLEIGRWGSERWRSVKTWLPSLEGPGHMVEAVFETEATAEAAVKNEIRRIAYRAPAPVVVASGDTVE